MRGENMNRDATVMTTKRATCCILISVPVSDGIMDGHGCLFRS